MTDPVQGLRSDLTRLRTILSRGGLLSFSEEETRQLLDDSQKALQKLDALSNGSLTVGIIGGTGVGKSTLMNALAGAEVSSTSHSRPHTDHVFLYHHSAVEVPATLTASGVPTRAFAHEVDAVRQVILCDLPDIDSLVGEHHAHALRFMEHLDVMVWVASLEKYADAKFYEFLRMAPKAKHNFYFVFNKLDRLFDGRSPDEAYENLARATARFQKHLEDAGILQPVVYVVSALQAAQGGPAPAWSQFAAFRRQIFQQRDIKEITAIKAANLDVEARRLTASLEKESLCLETMRHGLREARADMENERKRWTEAGAAGIDAWVEGSLREHIRAGIADATPLVGVGRALALISREWGKWSREKRGSTGEAASLLPPEKAAAALKRNLERLEDRIVMHFMRMGLQTSDTDPMRLILNAGEEWEELTGRWRSRLETRLAAEARHSSVVFIGMQYILYAALFFAFVMALAGEPAWSGFMENPGRSTALYVALAALYTLFSPTGLAALCTYGALNVLLGFHFFRRFGKSLDRRALTAAEAIRTELKGVWREEPDRVAARMEECDKRLADRIADLSSLNQPTKDE
ncbi:MAG: GTPase [Syntrophobacteraceae bacterium]